MVERNVLAYNKDNKNLERNDFLTRLNKTKSNLENIWQQLDDACGSLDNAFYNIGSMTGLEDIKDEASQIDFSAIVALKTMIEELIEKK